MRDQLFKLIILVFISIAIVSCKKYLNDIPDKSLIVPSSLSDLQGLLDNTQKMNSFNMGLGEASADNYYLSDNDWESLSEGDRNTYIWGDELFFDASINEWKFLYVPVYYANIVLENLTKIPISNTNRNEWNNLKGSALFYRARSFYFLITTFSKAYDSSTSSSDLGIPLRLTTDFNKPSTRANVKQSYNQIIHDLVDAIPLLPVIPLYPTRPSKPAAYGLLSRTYLSMRNYVEAGLYADSCLQLFNTLMDYNGGLGVNGVNARHPFSTFNPEVIFHATGGSNLLKVNIAKIDSNLYRSYRKNDLRRTLFFSDNGDGSYSFKGNYYANSVSFVGLATDEMYLTKAECIARIGKTKEAMKVLNLLLSKRWSVGTFVPFTATDPDDALKKVLIERRKELLMRDIRWMDIKRLNKTGANITIKRIIMNESHILKPNDNRFALPLPLEIVKLTALPQNPR